MCCICTMFAVRAVYVQQPPHGMLFMCILCDVYIFNALFFVEVVVAVAAVTVSSSYFVYRYRVHIVSRMRVSGKERERVRARD